MEQIRSQSRGHRGHPRRPLRKRTQCRTLAESRTRFSRHAWQPAAGRENLSDRRQGDPLAAGAGAAQFPARRILDGRSGRRRPRDCPRPPLREPHRRLDFVDVGWPLLCRARCAEARREMGGGQRSRGTCVAARPGDPCTIPTANSPIAPSASGLCLSPASSRPRTHPRAWPRNAA
jgi:hypothetical protein